MQIKPIHLVAGAVLVAAATFFAARMVPGYYAKRVLKNADIELSSKTFVDAACRDDIGTVALMLDAGMNANAQAPSERRNNAQTTALYCAASAGDVKLIDLLIARGATVDARNQANETALFAAASPNYLPFRAPQAGFDAVSELLAKGAQINAKSDNGTVLHAACRSGNMKLVGFLLDHGADASITDARGMAPLGACATTFFNSAEIPFDRLMVKGVNIDAAGADGTTLLNRAVQMNNINLVQKLLSLGANPNAADASGDTPLIHAVRNMQLLNLLVDKGAEVNHAGHDGTALLAALRMQSVEAVGYLLSKGADATVADAQGNTALHYAAQNFRTTGAIAMLIHAGASVNAVNQEGNTPLHLAARSRNEAAVDALLAAGAKVNAKNYAGQTPLALARSPWAPFPVNVGGMGIIGGVRVVNEPPDAKHTPTDLEKALTRRGGTL